MRILPFVLAAGFLVVAMSGCTSTTTTDSSTSGTGTPAVSDPRFESKVTLATSMGNITIGMYDQMVPLTAQNFETLVTSHSYDGTKVSRIVKGYDVQMGDLTTAGKPTPTYKVPDEFHPALRHDRPGMVSMATASPDTGNTQFFITTAAVPSYDDRYSVFGHVIEGMEVVNAMEQAAINGTAYGTPLSPITILQATLVHAEPPADATTFGAALAAPTTDKLGVAGTNVTFAVVVTNTGNVRDTFTLTANAPSGWVTGFVNSRVALPAGRSWVMPLRVAAPGDGDVTVTARSEADANKTASLGVHVRIGSFGPLPKLGQHVAVQYTGMLEDGRVFDTSRQDVAGNAALTQMSSYFQRRTFEPYEFTLGSGDVAGFVAQVQLTHVGETSVTRIPWNLGYLSNALNAQILYHRNIYFEVEVLSATQSPAGETVCEGAAKSILTLENASHTVVALSTSVGCMAIELYDDKSPVTVQNFLTYVREGFYTNVDFYRIVPGFVNQGGGGHLGKTATHPPIKNEAKTNGLHNLQYTVAMARTTAPDSADSEFYINAADNTEGHNPNLDPNPQGPDGYAVFGNVVAGRDISDRINAMSTTQPPPAILSVTVVN